MVGHISYRDHKCSTSPLLDRSDGTKKGEHLRPEQKRSQVNDELAHGTVLWSTKNNLTLEPRDYNKMKNRVELTHEELFSGKGS